MLLLTIRTDKPEAEIGLYDGSERMDYTSWQAHRELAETIQQRLSDLLRANDRQLSDLEAIVAFEGPGSFTGLRIGLTVANTLAYSLDIPITGTTGEDWIADGITGLTSGKASKLVLPEYGAPVHITQQKK
jgi:tRNA threonylcarbamoyladenosine biosynthesis protein TsaB